MVSMRDTFGKILVELGKENRQVVVLDGDLASSTRTSLFAQQFPDRFIEVGIAEQNMVGIAAGLACVGKIPFVTSFACFCTKRVYDQISVSVAYPKLNVKIMGCYSGIFTGKTGATHHSIEDIAMMRSTPNMVVVVPADAIELVGVLRFAAKYFGPVYVRIARDDYPILLSGHDGFRLGEYPVLRDGRDLSILSCGEMVSVALDAAEALGENRVEARVVNISTIKPANEEAIIAHARETGAFVTVENHLVIGGLGGLVSEILGENYPIPLERVGIKDTFCESGSNKELSEKYGLTKEAVVSAAQRVLERKSGILPKASSSLDTQKRESERSANKEERKAGGSRRILRNRKRAD
jgi:transketolase